ncbi:MAG: leucine-rich repeat domain-containing protein [Flavobacteriales bacterium]|nr:leucine-rich repeat domain-containing protein [Flavobacteriales bacterium]
MYTVLRCIVKNGRPSPASGSQARFVRLVLRSWFFFLVPYSFSPATHAQPLPQSTLDTVRTYRSLERALAEPMQVYRLDLSKQKLKAVPEELRRLPNLNALDLGRNKLKELPAWFTDLAHLQELTLSGNKLVAFPEVILRVAPPEATGHEPKRAHRSSGLPRPPQGAHQPRPVEQRPGHLSR